MEKTVMQRLEFLMLSLVLAAVVSIWRPTVYGNNEASIKRYIYQAMGQQLGGHVELISVDDFNEDRFAVFRLEDRKSDHVWCVQFRRNQSGNYEGCGYISQMI